MDTTDSAAPSSRKASARTPRPPRVRLDTLSRLKRELARLYVEGREGRRDVGDVSRLANVLSIVGRLLEGAELERRLEALEARP